MEILHTQRLLLRRFTPEDGQGLLGYLSLPEVVEFEPYGVLSAEECQQEAQERAHNPAFWAVCSKQTGQLIGNLYFQQEASPFSTWELGYVFHPQFQGKGYATEACLRLLQYAFETLHVRRVVAHCEPKNAKSWKLLDRLQFRREGHMLQTVYFKRALDGSPLWHDTYCYALLHSEWEERKAKQ